MTTAPSSFWQIMWHTRLRDMLRGRIDGRTRGTDSDLSGNVFKSSIAVVLPES